jgi:hypothetical protein
MTLIIVSVILKILPKAAYGVYTGEKSTNEREGQTEQEF